MTGLIVLGLIAAYVAIFVFVVRETKGLPQRVAATAVAIAIPSWDLPIGYLHYREQCSVGGGIQKLAEVTPQRSLYFTYVASQPDLLLKAGFDAVEFSNPSGGVRRYIRDSNGIRSIDQPSPSSLLQIRRVPEKHVGWNVFQRERVLEEIKSGKPLIIAHQYAWRGGWLQNLISRPTPLLECNTTSFNEVPLLALGKR